jgi:hypothetical protein
MGLWLEAWLMSAIRNRFEPKLTQNIGQILGSIKPIG